MRTRPCSRRSSSVGRSTMALVVAALEAWAAGEAAGILGGIFLVAAVVTLAAIPAALAMGRRPRILSAAGTGYDRDREAGEGGDGDGRARPGVPADHRPLSRSPTVELPGRAATCPTATLPTASASSGSSAGRPRTGRPASRAPRPSPRPLSTRRAGLDRPRRADRSTGRGGRRRARPAPARRRGHRGAQPAGQGRADRRESFMSSCSRSATPVRRTCPRSISSSATGSCCPPTTPPGSRQEASGLRHAGEPACRAGPTYLLWALVDAIVDGYFPVLDRIEDEIDRLQDDVLDRPARLDAPAALPAEARAHRAATGDRSGPRGLQPADEPRDRAHPTRARSSTSGTSTTTSSGSPTSSTPTASSSPARSTST